MKAALFICLALASSSYATVIVATTTALTTAQLASFYYGVGAVKALALGALGVGAILANSRSKRQVEDIMDETFNLVSQSEPEQCVHRLICDLATGQMPPSSNDVIMRLFENTEAVPQASPVFDFAVAAEVGKLVKDVQKCEIQYSCVPNKRAAARASSGGKNPCCTSLLGTLHGRCTRCFGAKRRSYI